MFDFKKLNYEKRMKEYYNYDNYNFEVGEKEAGEKEVACIETRTRMKKRFGLPENLGVALILLALFTMLFFTVFMSFQRTNEYKNKGVRINCTIEDITVHRGRDLYFGIEIEMKDNNGKLAVFYIQETNWEQLKTLMKEQDSVLLQEYVNDKGTHSYYMVKEVNGEKVNLESKLIKLRTAEKWFFFIFILDKRTLIWYNINIPLIIKERLIMNENNFKYTIENGGVTITGYIGDPVIVEIPPKIEGCPATSIGEYAFSGCTNLTSIDIPDSVTSIGDDAFERCTGLISITLPDSVTSIGEYAFWGCSELTSITIPNSVTAIGGWAFEDCRGLTSIELPSSITSINNGTFADCKNLTSIFISDSVVTIGDWVFYNCSSLITIEIPNSVTSIGENAFFGCAKLTSIDIPNSVTYVGEDAFYGCKNLKKVTVSEKLFQENKDVFKQLKDCEFIFS